MSQESHESIDIKDIFPEIKEIKSPPAMGTLNGFGFSCYGRRDYHPETNTYVITHVICALFIPIISLGAYRVQDCETGGWYFIGKEPLSSFAKFFSGVPSWGAGLIRATFVVVIRF